MGLFGKWKKPPQPQEPTIEPPQVFTIGGVNVTLANESIHARKTSPETFTITVANYPNEEDWRAFQTPSPERTLSNIIIARLHAKGDFKFSNNDGKIISRPSVPIQGHLVTFSEVVEVLSRLEQKFKNPATLQKLAEEETQEITIETSPATYRNSALEKTRKELAPIVTDVADFLAAQNQPLSDDTKEKLHEYLAGKVIERKSKQGPER